MSNGKIEHTELLPCPFCGGEAEIERMGNHLVSTQYACTTCGCFLETGEEFNYGNSWNTRVNAVPGLVKALEEILDASNDPYEIARAALAAYRSRG